MIYEMNLNPEPFRLIKVGQKTIELRLNDERRATLAIGDQIVFTSTDDLHKTLTAEIISLYHFPTFKELYESLPLEKCGYQKGEKANYHDMEIYYSQEAINKYGVLGIEIRLIK